MLVEAALRDYIRTADDSAYVGSAAAETPRSHIVELYGPLAEARRRAAVHPGKQAELIGAEDYRKQEAFTRRAPHDKGSHADDVVAVVATIHADHGTLPPAQTILADAVTGRGIEVSRVDDWSAVAGRTRRSADSWGKGRRRWLITRRWSGRWFRTERVFGLLTKGVMLCRFRTG
ncbi:MAG: hypothetical protein ACRDTK_00880 [Mycobacterium sp.]